MARVPRSSAHQPAHLPLQQHLECNTEDLTTRRSALPMRDIIYRILEVVNAILKFSNYFSLGARLGHSSTSPQHSSLDSDASSQNKALGTSLLERRLRTPQRLNALCTWAIQPRLHTLHSNVNERSFGPKA